MHGLPCSSFSHCFGSSSDANIDPGGDLGESSRSHNGGAEEPVMSQSELQVQENQTTISSTISSTRRAVVCRSCPAGHNPDTEEELTCGSSEDEDMESEQEMKFPQIPRPSIIVPPQDSDFQEMACVDWQCGDSEDGGSSADPTLSLSAGRSVMAEPDYLDGDCDELIKPKKLINPVKNSRNHQDMHRELMMNQKRGLAPQNKPELQKVLEKRKREQILKAQKEEQEAHKKRSDLEVELMKRQQKLEQLELEQQKNEEEQENTPEFVKMKSNLRRTRQGTDGEEHST